MPPHLHPRSRSTTSLFAATLLASFFIVGVPHIFPCPAPRHTLADSDTIVTSDGRIRKRRRKITEPPEQVQSIESTGPTPDSSQADELATFRQMEKEAKALEKTGRECPVPKPRGIVGQILGFEEGKGSTRIFRTDNPGQEPER